MLGLSGKVDPMLAAWAPDILFFIVGIWFLFRIE
jgi:lipopolysaccharide export LptBFGC system permease protein LptF